MEFWGSYGLLLADTTEWKDGMVSTAIGGMTTIRRCKQEIVLLLLFPSLLPLCEIGRVVYDGDGEIVIVQRGIVCHSVSASSGALERTLVFEHTLHNDNEESEP